jgi:uncharacterized protein
MHRPLPVAAMSDAKSEPEQAGPENSPEAAMPVQSMEEIIASISRIMAEDARPTEVARSRSPEPASDVLELTEAIGADGLVRRLTPGSGPSVGSERGAGSGAASPAKPIEPDRPASPRPLAAAAEGRHERILSAASSEAAAAAFARLGALPRERRAGADLPIGAGTRTLEDIVRDSLQPLLQAWLDEHLPGIVERLVRDAIGQVVAEAGLR